MARDLDKPRLAMVLIAVMLCIALLKGMDGALLASGIGILAGLGGYEAGKKRAK